MLAFCQSPVRCLAVAVDAVMRRANHHDEAVMRQFAEPIPDIVASRTKFLRGDPRGNINRVAEIFVVPPFQHDIEAPSAVAPYESAFHAGVFRVSLSSGTNGPSILPLNRFLLIAASYDLRPIHRSGSSVRVSARLCDLADVAKCRRFL